MTPERDSSGGRARAFSISLAGFLIASLCASCAWRVHPAPEATATAYVLDYGRHSSLLLPGAGATWTEYAFGDWDYFARSRTGAWTAAKAVLGLSQATLGRRTLRLSDARAKRAVAVPVDGAAVRRLRARLEAQFARGQAAAHVHNEEHGLDFVPSEDSYNLFQSSNQATATWLEALGCRVSGVPLLSNFRVEAVER